MVKKNSIEALINEALAGMLSILNDDEKRLIIENFHIQTYKKNEMIYNEGEKAELLMCLIKGKVKIFKAGIGGRCQIMRLIRPIQYFGYRAYFAGEDYITAASAFENATIGFLPMPLIESLVKQNNRLAYFYQGTGDGLRNVRYPHRKSHTKTYPRPSRRIIAHAQRQLRYGRRRHHTKHLYGTRRLGQSIEHDYIECHTHLSCFADEKIIAIDGRKIQIIDESRLRKISRFG